ncbi:hypothetical protein EAG_16283 [Camponotus floridanus]|uniref:Uncharacterized protein n=1 Tax=Camponotus floridanus TaxID=104421 RepID=E2AGB0_CAMFO|nr:hypothetical protein EAG_16283 [Camponotus floridanus]
MSVDGGGSPRGSSGGWQPAATVSVVTGGGGSGGNGSGDGGGSASPGVAFRRRGWKSRETEGCPRRSLVLARTRTPGWPGVLLWIRRSRLDIDKWLAEGEPNTAPLLHMQGHPFVPTKWRRGKGTENFDRRAFLDITRCLVRASGTDAGRTADSTLLSDDAWQEASMAAKIIGTFPDCRRWPRNKVHFHGITISGNWHLQQHRDVLSSPPAALSYFRTGRRYTERQKEMRGGDSVQGMRADRKYQAAASSSPCPSALPLLQLLHSISYNHLSSFDGSTIFFSLASRGVSPATSFLLEPGTSLLLPLSLFLVSSPLIPEHPIVTDFDVRHGKKSFWRSMDRHCPPILVCASLGHGRPVMLLMLLELSFHLATCPEAPNVPREVRNENVRWSVSLRRRFYEGGNILREPNYPLDARADGGNEMERERKKTRGIVMLLYPATTDSGSWRRDHNDDDDDDDDEKTKKWEGQAEERFARRKSEMCSGTFNNPSMKLLVIRDAIPDTPDLITHPPGCCCLISCSRYFPPPYTEWRGKKGAKTKEIERLPMYEDRRRKVEGGLSGPTPRWTQRIAITN